MLQTYLLPSFSVSGRPSTCTSLHALSTTKPDLCPACSGCAGQMLTGTPAAPVSWMQAWHRNELYKKGSTNTRIIQEVISGPLIPQVGPKRESIQSGPVPPQVPKTGYDSFDLNHSWGGCITARICSRRLICFCSRDRIGSKQSEATNLVSRQRANASSQGRLSTTACFGTLLFAYVPGDSVYKSVAFCLVLVSGC